MKRLDDQMNDGHRCIVQSSSWNDERGMQVYADEIFGPWIGNRPVTSLMLLDDFAAHKCTPVRDAFARYGAEVDIIPPSYTGRLQAVDVGINKPFKDRIRTLWDAWMIEELTARPGTAPKVSRPLIRQWAVQAWREIPQEMITATWRKIGL